MQANLSPNDAQAIAMLREAGITPTKDEVIVLSDDLLSIMDEELDDSQDDDANAEDAVELLTKRIGGLRNLRSYLNCLLVR